MPSSPPIVPTSEQIGAHIRQARQSAGLSQLSLAKAIGQMGDQREVRSTGYGGSSYISRLENGKFPEIRISTLQRIAAALGVGLDDLILSPGSNGQKNGKKTKGGRK